MDVVKRYCIDIFIYHACIFIAVQYDSVYFKKCVQHRYSGGDHSVSPEFRRGLETLGRKKFFDYIMHEDPEERGLSDKTIYD